MALSRHHLSNRLAQNHFKAAAFLLLTTTTTTILAASEAINWSVIFTTAIVSTSVETKFTSPVLTSDSIATSSNSNSRSQDNSSPKYDTHTFRKYDEDLDRQSANREIVQLEKASSEKLYEEHTPNVLSNTDSESKICLASECPATDPHWNSDENESTRFNRETPPKCPKIRGSDGCDCEEDRIDCSGLNITALTFLESIQKKVKEINVARNHLHAIPLIHDAPFLLQLSLAQNDIVMANVKTLQHVPLLEVLDLSANKIEILNLSGVDFENLKHLNISFNRLKRFWSPYLQLTHLDIQGNEITDVSFLVNLRQLMEVNLQQNRIKDILADTFQNLTKLEILNLSDNQLQNADFVIQISKYLIGLVLNNNKIRIFPKNALMKSHIVFLILKNNSLTDGTFLVHQKAAELFLSDNPLFELKSKWFEGKSLLKVLNVTRTNLTSIDFVTSIPALIRLSIVGNNITCLPKNFLKRNTTLIEFYVSDNPLEDLICPVTNEWTDGICNITASNDIIQISMQDKNINDVMGCVLKHRKLFEDCEQKCNNPSSASHTFTSLLIMLPILLFVV